MPGVGRYHCKSCRYVANNRRMLARHVALIHCDKVFKCPVCPFVTRYAANWYRHKRSLHGINKKDMTCEACGFFANSAPELARHKEEAHPDPPRVEKDAGKERAKSSSKLRETDLVETEAAGKDDEFEVEDGSSLDEEKESVSISLPANGFYDSVVAESFGGNAGKTVCETVTMNDTSASGNLRPLRVRRSYNCDRCGLLTNNPREFLYHLQSIHGEKLSIHECKYCVYASKHVQKLQRHCNLVHRQQLAKDPDYQKQLEAAKEKRSKPEVIALPLPAAAEKYLQSPKVPNKPALKIRPNPTVFKCTVCPYQTRSKSLLLHHEKTAHFRKKFYRCLQCGYVTNEKGRYTKHIKYHSLPKMQCEYCFFKTAYKWNMDRHMKNHEDNAEGEFRCNLCNFTTSTKQSFKAHVTNHHDPTADDVAEQDMEMEGPNESSDWEDLDFDEAETSNIQMDDNASYDCYEFPEARETPDMVWKDGKAYQKTLKCKSCDFKAAWPFEMKKHEETHKGQKKHHCPLCGMRFEHIAWLTKHLRRVHRESSQAKNIAAAFDLLKPNRRRPGKEYTSDAVLPMFQDVLKQNTKPALEPSKPSMLSSLLKKPLHTFSSAANRYGSVKAKVYNNSSQNAMRQTKLPTYYDKSNAEESYEAPGFKSKSVPTCNVCGYKTRWISELQRHMRVHSQEKPFQCPKCKYHCKWKGDLNRHLMKYHGIKVPTPGKKQTMPKMKFKASADAPGPVNDWQSNSQEKRSDFSTSTPLRKDQESPLDLTLGKETFPHPHHNESVYDAYDFDSQSALDSDLVDVVSVDDSNPASRYSPFKSPLAHLRESSNLSDDSSNAGGRRKYRCPFCTFETTTASRFHVHIVQHYNRRPFMCSVCGYNSNWEWDITKHIRLKGCRDKSHNKACVLLTDESGKRNYEKYDKYLTDIDQDKPPEPPARPPEVGDVSESVKYSACPPTFNNALNKSCSYDFRNIGSNFEEPQDMPENIVVTPDIDLSEPLDMLDNQSDMLQIDLTEGPFQENSNEAKQFYCKHCNFKHTTKRVVVSHLSVHAGIKPFRCRACGMSSNWRHVIVRHVKDAHNGYMNEVEDRINFVQEGYALRLTSINAGDSPMVQPGREMSQTEQFGCKICPYKCDKEFYMKFHMKQHRPREGAVFKCEFCPYFVKFKKTLVRHLKLHNVPPIEDVQSNADVGYVNDGSFASQPILYQDDMYDFYENGQNDSAEDDSIVISFDKLNQSDQVEQTSPPKVKRHVCEHCPYKTDNKTQYLYHKQFHRPNPSAPFKCSICTYWATMQHLLTQHMKVHSDADTSTESEQAQKPEAAKDPCPPAQEEPSESPEKDDLDEKISAVYVKRGDLIVKMFKCLFCPMMNKKKANVRVHQKMHGVIVNDGKFACTYCNYQCLNQGGLTNHIKVHQKVPEKQVEESELEAENPKKIPEPVAHVEENRKGYTYFCMNCPAVFKSAPDLQIHSKFHGAEFPFPCTECDYHARHRPHLVKHMTVHGAEYKAKRAAAENQNSDNAKTQVNDAIVYRNVSSVKKVDQMLLLEASEMKKAYRKKEATTHNLHKCTLCPSVFFKSSTLAYHISLHGSDGEFKCPQCDYAVGRSGNLTVHSQVHPKRAAVKRPLKTFPCTRCPALFYKQDRFDRHQLLHGQNYKFRCEHCDYSVRFAANLIKHRNLHAAKKDAENAGVSVAHAGAGPQDTRPLVDNANFQITGEKKTVFICDRCPYFQTRKDAVQSHQRRHWLNDGFKCPYCDYSSMQSSFLQNHIKIHIQPSQIFPPHAFIKYKSFKIFCKDEGNDTLLFDDEDMKSDECDDEPEEEESGRIQIPKKKLVKFSHSSKSENGSDSPSTDSSKRKRISNIPSKYNENSLDSNASESSKRKRSSNTSFKCDDNSLDSISSDSLKRKKFTSEILKCDENSYDSISSNNSKVPVVVLSDIFGSKKGLKKLNQLKIPKYNFKSAESPKSSTKDSTGSLVLKIKLKSCLVNKHEKTMYSVSTSERKETPKVAESRPASNEDTNDSYSDVLFGDSKRTDSTSPVDIEENTLTSTSGISDTLRAADDVDDIMDSIVGPEADDLLLSNPLNDAKSDDSFSNDTVPVVVGEICEKLGGLGDISFKDELSLSNGTCSSSLANGLLPGEIKI